MVAVSGSRLMISAVRNGPMRIVDMKMNRMPDVVARLITTREVQPKPVCGMFQFCATSETAMNIAVDEIIEYQVVSRASAPTRKARVVRRTAMRQQPAPIA